MSGIVVKLVAWLLLLSSVSRGLKMYHHVTVSFALGFDAGTDCSCVFPPDLKVIITGADVAMASAVAEHLPNTVPLHFLCHMMKNVTKKCQGALGQRTSYLQKLFYACEYATSENAGGMVKKPCMDQNVSAAITARCCPGVH